MARPWERWERALYRKVSDTLRREGARLVRLIKEQGQSAVISPEFWAESREALFQSVLSSILGLSRLGVAHGRERLGITMQGLVDWGLVNRDAEEWARQYAGELVGGISETTLSDLRRALGDWTISGEPLSVLQHSVFGLVSDKRRAKTIATTEATRVYAEGNTQVWSRAGVREAAFKPPLHPNCRCYLQPWRLRDGTWVVRWYTARDERVCVVEYPVPWGKVKGCKGLHGVCVSAGDWLGKRLR